MKTKSELKWIALLLLPIAVIPAGLMWKTHEQNQTVSWHATTIFTESNDDRHSLAALSEWLEKDTSNIVQISYGAGNLDGSLTYNRNQKTLTKELYPMYTFRWQNVEETAIHQIAAPMRKLLKTHNTQAINAYKNGKIDELQQYGATPVPSKE